MSDELFEIRTKVGTIRTSRNVNTFLGGCYILFTTMAGNVLGNTIPVIIGAGVAGTVGMVHTIKAISDQKKLSELKKQQEILEEANKIR